MKRGAGLEFADYRPLSPGDDIRAIDWNAYARHRHLLLKLFEEEEDLHVHLLLDTSASMQWGEPPKFDLARQIVAGLAYLALANLDRASVGPIGPGAPPLWRASRGRGRFLPLLRYLEACQTSGGAHELAPALARWLATRPRRGVVLWVTDAWGRTPEDAFLALDRLRYARHEIGVIQIRHQDELRVSELGEFEYEEVEAAQRKTVIVDRAAARAYAAAVEAYEARLRDYCRRHAIALLQADAAQSPIAILRRSLLEGGFVQ